MHSLLRERTQLIQEVEVYTDQSELAYELEAARAANAELRRRAEASRESASRAVRERERAERARDEALA